MEAYATEGWSELFVASAGAAAALAGLVFVAVSINIERILLFEGLPERALETLLLLIGVVVVSLIGLVPGQSRTALGVELLAESLCLAAALALLSRRGKGAGYRASRLGLLVPGVVPFVVGGASILAGSGGGLYWTAAGIVAAIFCAVMNAWVLLVEILR